MKRERLYLFSILIIALLLRLYHFDYFSVWDDEARTYIVSAATSWVNVLKMQQLQIPANTPLDPLIRHLSMKIGQDTTFFFMLPSVIFSLLGILCSFMLARRLFGIPVAMITAILLTVHPLDIAYAQEGRNYAILNAVIPVASILLLRAMDTNKKLNWLLYSISLSICYYSHLLTLGIAITHGIYFIIMTGNDFLHGKSRKAIISLSFSYILSASLSIILFIPWLLPYFQYSAFTPWSNGPGTIYYSLKDVILIFNAGVFKFIPIGLTVVGIAGLLLRREKNALFVVLTILVSSAASYEATKNNFFHIRYIFFTLPFFLMVTAYGISLLSEKVLQLLRRVKTDFMRIEYLAGIIIFLISLNNIPVLAAGYEYGWEKTFDGDWRGAAEYVNNHYKEYDAIIVPHRLHANFDTYNKLPTYGFEVTEQHAIIIPSHEIIENSLTGREWGIIMYNNRYPDYNEEIARYIASKKYSRLWVIWNFQFNLTKEDLFLSLLLKNGKPVDVKKFTGVVVTLWEISPQ